MGKILEDMAALYERLEAMPTAAPDMLTVRRLEIWEAHGEPWPISGDATAILTGHRTP